VGRPKLNMIFISLKIPPSWQKELDRLSEDSGISKSQIMRTAIEKEMIEMKKKFKRSKKA
jgi:predicted DNA-binding protein